MQQTELVSLPRFGDSRSMASSIYMAVPRHDASGYFLAAELNADFLWVPAGVQGRPQRVCVLGEDGAPVFCNQVVDEQWLTAARQMALKGEPAREFHSEGGSFLSAAWGLFLEPHYGVEYWYFTVGASTAEVLAPVRMFQTVFPVIVVLVLSVSLLVSIRLVRGNLQPLERILQATRRLGAVSYTHLTLPTN